MTGRRVLPRELARLQREIEQRARAVGLDFFPVVFELLSGDEMSEVAAYGGFPTRYPHWRFGMEYNRLSKSASFGLHRIYEMVINSDPCYAYLLEGNSLVDQKMVMAHVMAHCDFFKNNLFFAGTSRKMVDEMANHRTKVVSFMDRLGQERVEWFLDACLSVENLIDVALGPAPARAADRRGRGLGGAAPAAGEGKGREEREEGPGRAKRYLAPFVKGARGERREETAREEPSVEVPSGAPPAPVKDVMGFLLAHAQLEGWERTVLELVRDEAYYFAPQGQTKIMNEGWATFWHSKLMTEKLLDASEIVDYADRASGITASHGVTLNPYKLGVELFRDIEERWNRGRFGKEWEECDDAQRRRGWDTGAGRGTKKVFEVRRVYNDVTFIEEFLTEEFCREKKLFVFGANDETKQVEILSRAFAQVKEQLLRQLTNLGHPVVEAVDANHENKGQLLLRHVHEGVDLRSDWAADTLRNLYKIWKRPVLISTVAGKAPLLMKYDGKEVTQAAAAP